MNKMIIESRIFLSSKDKRHNEAMQRAALQILYGIDLDLLLNSSPQERKSAAKRLARLIERERIKGLRKHWSYDLNRHISLKQAFDRLQTTITPIA